MVRQEHEAIPSRMEVIRRFKAEGGRIAAVFPVHVPRALLRAFGVLPVEVWGPPGTDPTRGDAHLQSYTCSIVRCGLSFLLGGGLDRVDLLLVPHACDSLQGLGSILGDFIRPAGKTVLPLYLPRDEGPGGEAFLASELRALADRLGELGGGRPDEQQLHASLQREARADRLLAALHEGRSRLPASSREFYRLVRAREYLPAEAFVAVAERALDRSGSEPPAGAAVIISGLVPEPMELLDVIDGAGAFVAADDLASCGRRLYHPPPLSDAVDPYQWMARALLSGPPDSTRGSSVQARAAHLRQLASRTGARAVIFWSIKFCEPEQFYLPLLRRELDRDGIRSLVLEVDLGEPLPDQIVTRTEALLETL